MTSTNSTGTRRKYITTTQLSLPYFSASNIAFTLKVEVSWNESFESREHKMISKGSFIFIFILCVIMYIWNTGVNFQTTHELERSILFAKFTARYLYEQHIVPFKTYSKILCWIYYTHFFVILYSVTSHHNFIIIR